MQRQGRSVHDRARFLLWHMLADYLERLVEGNTPPPLDGEVVLDLFAGTASFLVAAVMEGRVVRAYRWVDNDPSAMYIAFATIVWILGEAGEGGRFEGLVNATTFADTFAWLDVQAISAGDVREASPSVVAMGSPCQGFSRAQQREEVRGVMHPESALFYAGVELAEAAVGNDGGARYLFENVANFANFPEEMTISPGDCQVATPSVVHQASRAVTGEDSTARTWWAWTSTMQSTVAITS